ncbi:MAG: DNA mismatch repair endonuclease MutL [Aggregatilineales bacterium]
MVIQLLTETVIAQIAAGEVVERPASVVKELIENALDAGAGSIHVTIQNGGQKLIRVSDDGSGIQVAEVDLAFARHATSKLRITDDLSRLSTLGFRGEALSSVASVSQVTLVTRHREDTIGVQLRVDGGVVVRRQSIGAPAGTVITVENLFYNTPARLKFLKKEATEKRYITALITRYAMAYPHVRFLLEQDGREIFRTSGSGQLADVIVKTLGLEHFRQMLEVDAQESARDDRPEVHVFGFTSAPEFHRSDRTHITLFVNGRWIQDTSLTYAVVQAYQSVIQDGRYPISVLMITLPPHEVDVNVHPTKAEVRFRDNNAVFETVQRAVRQAVLELINAPDVSSGYSVIYPESRGNTTIPSPQGRFSNFGSNWYSGQDQLEMDLTLDNPGQVAPRRANDDGHDEWHNIPDGMGAPAKPRTLPVLRVVGQIGATYIIAEGPAGMYLIDQNAAHVRVIYEEVEDILKLGDIPEQLALDQFTFDVSSADGRALELQADVFQSMGFLLEAFGPNTMSVRRIPAIIRQAELSDFFREIVKVLRDEPQMAEDIFRDELLLRVARGGAVRAGQVLKTEQMQDIVRRLERSRTPLKCPEGRSILIHMSGDQLAREFRRG